MSVTCPKCGLTSHDPSDIRWGYCKTCKDWTSFDAPSSRPEGKVCARCGWEYRWDFYVDHAWNEKP